MSGATELGSRTLVVALVGALAGCGSSGDRPAVTFVCPDGSRLEATFFPTESRVRVDAGGRTYDLPQAISASGARYFDGTTTFWNKGREALFETPDSPKVSGCVSIPGRP